MESAQMALLRGRESRSTAFLAVVGLVVAVLAGFHRGVPTADLHFNDGGIWVTNGNLQLLGHLNYQSRTLDGGLRSKGADLDVTQSGYDVLLRDSGGSIVSAVDPARVTRGQDFAVPNGMELLQGGSIAALLDSAGGRLWVVPATQVSTLSSDAPPTFKGARNLQAVVSTTGTVLALAPNGAITRIADGGAKVQESDRLPDYQPSAEPVLTAVGDEPVVYSASANRLWTTKASRELAAGDAAYALQLPGPVAENVVLAGPDGLLSVPLDKGDPTTIELAGGDNPARPVVVAGCAYAAWAGTGGYLRDCPGSGSDDRRTVPELAKSTSLTFRVNRDLVVLNDTNNGKVFLVNDQFKVVESWDPLEELVAKDEKGSDKSNTTTPERAPGKREKQNHPPVAENDDKFGVRPGRATTLPVLANDSDQDGDILTARVTKPPVAAEVALARGGEALQLTVPATATGTRTFTYEAADGRGGTDTAQVDVKIHPLSENAAPIPIRPRPGTLTIAAHGTGTYAVLPDWIDPDGDAILLKGVVAPDDLKVRFRPDGVITVTDVGDSTGPKELQVTVSDGSGVKAGEATGTLAVQILAGDGNRPPDANADHVRVLVDQDVVVSPLANDTDPDGDTLRLASVGRPAAGGRITADTDAGTFTFSSSQVGIQYIDYQVTDGPAISKGVVRIDVVDSGKGAPPVADSDLALLPDNGSVLVDVLDNDFDPNGGVLVVQSVSPPELQAGLTVQILDHALIRVTAPGGLTKQTSFTYTVANATGTATGQVTVVPVPPGNGQLQPIAVDDGATVRAGDLVSVDVLANDESPSGAELTVDPTLQAVGKSDLGTFFVTDKQVRFKSSGKPGRARATYTIRDPDGNFASADVVVSIRPKGKNSPPKPKPLVARVLAGSSVKIAVPLEGVDPDGDSVNLLGLDDSPTKGTATVEGDQLVYTAPTEALGTDVFSYTVADQSGDAASATVRVGIAPPPPLNLPPVAVTDQVTARPDTPLAIPVLGNDFDPDGDAVTVVAGSVKPVSTTTTVRATLTEQRVQLTTPKREGVLQYYYDISDGHGGTSRGSLTVTVSRDAPTLPPIARDDTVPAPEVIGKPTVTVDVLTNDEDPDGDVNALTVTSAEPGVKVENGKLVVPVTANRQILVYRVTDRDRLYAEAVVFVPGDSSAAANSAPPRLRQEKLPIHATAGNPVTIPLGEYVIVRSGHRPRITYGKKVHAPVGSDGTDLVKDAQTLVFTPAKDFSGSSALTFEVTDGADAEDPKGLTATLTIPIVVTGANAPPTFTPSQVQVEVGEPAISVDLRPMARDTDPGDQGRLTFALTDAPRDLKVSLSGTTLRVEAPVGRKPGASASARLTVSDGTNKPVPAVLPIEVVASRRPLMTTTTAVIANASAGRPEQIDLTDYVTNPYADQGKPIALVGAPSVTAGSGTATASGTVVTVTPKDDFHGRLVVGYTVKDATNLPDRQVQGQIQLTVRGKPEPPTGVTAATNASRTASVSWTPGANNGAPITGFTVTWSGGRKECGAVTTCTIDGLTNDTEYSFSVTATNEVGVSDPSRPSPSVRPDASPDAPAAPSTAFGDKEIAVSWTAPHTDGSAVTGYVLEISPPAGGRTQQEVSGTSYTWTGLTNGTAYKFRVQAKSKAEKPSDFSDYSSAETPAGPPASPAAPSATMSTNKNLPPEATIQWAAPNGNGDDAMTYVVTKVGGGTVYTGTALSAVVTLVVDDSDQTFTVTARNKAGTGKPSPSSNAVRAYNAPGAVSGVKVNATGQDNQVAISFTPGAANGARPGELTYVWSANGREGTLPSGGGTVTDAAAFPNGSDVGVTVRARATVDGRGTDGDPSAATTVNAYGPPRPPTVKASGGVNDVTLSWSASGSANGRPIVAVEITTSDDGPSTQSVTGSTTRGNGRNQTKWITARAKDSAGNWSGPSAQASATTWPDPYSVTSHGGGCTSPSGCRWVYVEVFRFTPGSVAHCHVDGAGPNSSWDAYLRVDAAGHAGPTGQGDQGRLFDTPSSPLADGQNSIPCDQQ